MKRAWYIVVALLAGTSPALADAHPAPAEQAYLSALAAHGLAEPNAGRPEDLARAVREADATLVAGDAARAAARLYGIVEGVRFAQLAGSDDFENAEYLLGVALARGGAILTARRYLERVATRAGTLYAAPALRQLVDLALARRDYAAQVSALDQLGIRPSGPLAEEIDYLRGRAAYAARHDAVAEDELKQVGPHCRFYSSAIYLRGVIAARRGNFDAAEDAFCSIADERSDADPLRFVIDRRYFTVRDLARLALGRIAHEQGRFDDALYHYFVIPSDSEELPHALFESAWSMLERRRLDLAGRLVDALLAQFPDSPLRPEGELLRATIDVKSCRFASAAREFQAFISAYQPVEREVARARHDAAARRALAARLLSRAALGTAAETRMSKLLELDPAFYRLRDLAHGLAEEAGDAAAVQASWTAVEHRLAGTPVAPVASAGTLDDAASLLARTRALGEGVASAHEDAIVMSNAIEPDARKAAEAELSTLSALEARRARLARALARAAAPPVALPPAGSTLAAMAEHDRVKAAGLRGRAVALQVRFDAAEGRLLETALDALEVRLQAMLRHAQLGQIDAVVGSKKVLEKQIEDLAAGRFPPSMQGRLSLDGLIGDDEEYWPFEGERWSDEYQDYR